jgi:N-glycosylase/DNA lyase
LAQDDTKGKYRDVPITEPMESGAIDCESLAGGLDFAATVESGQSYLWTPEGDRSYDQSAASGGADCYWTTVHPGDGLAAARARQVEGTLEWESSVDATEALARRLGLGDDLPAIRESAPEDDVVRAAYNAYWGLRVVRDPPFPALVSFICSTQMRVARIHGMQRALREAFGRELTLGERTYHAYPTPAALAEAGEGRLRELALGYRAPYVAETARMIADGEADPGAARGRPYEDAREYLTQFVGVGEKVADCVLLFSLGYLEAVPLDTWIRTTIAEYYPDCDRGSYAETSEAIRAALGGAYAGYAQTYVFHYLRNGATPA